jgi:hypothetical protein
VFYICGCVNLTWFNDQCIGFLMLIKYVDDTSMGGGTFTTCVTKVNISFASDPFLKVMVNNIQVSYK